MEINIRKRIERKNFSNTETEDTNASKIVRDTTVRPDRITGPFFVLKFPYNGKLVEEIKKIFPSAYRAYVPTRQCWVVSDIEAKKLMEFGERHHFFISEDLKKAVEAFNKTVEASSLIDKDISIPAPEGMEYLPYQKAGIHYCLERKHAIIGDEMGLGKTIQALGVVNATQAKHVLVVCPASLQKNWQREAQKWLVDANDRSIDIIKGRQFVSRKDTPTMRILSYDSLSSHIDDALFSTKYDLIVYDEAHFMKNQKTERTKMGLKLAADRKIFLTGTPILNRPIELYPILSHIGASPAGNWRHYVERYCGAYQTEFGFNVNGASNLVELQTLLRGECLVRRLKKDVLTELPEKRRQPLVWEAVTQAEKAALKAEAQLLKKIKDDIAKLSKETKTEEGRAKIRAAKFSDIGEIAEARKVTAVAKAPRVGDTVAEMLTEGGTDKVIVFGHHKEVLDILMEKLAAFKPVRLDGSMSLAQRQDAVDTFSNDKDCRVFVGSIRAAGVGLTLTAASTVVFSELDWTPGALSQAEDRAHRIGQKNAVLSVIPLLEDSIDGFMYKKIESKQVVIDKLMNATKDDSPSTNKDNGEENSEAVTITSLLEDIIEEGAKGKKQEKAKAM